MWYFTRRFSWNSMPYFHFSRSGKILNCCLLQIIGLQKIVEIKDFSRLLSGFPVLFKADLIFKDFSRKPSKFKYFSSLCEPCVCQSTHVICLIWFFKTQSTIFQLCRDGSSSVEPALSKDKCVLHKDTTQWHPWGSNTWPLGLESSTLPLSHYAP